MKFVLVIFLLLMGCQSPEKYTCVERDWYEIGRHSGLTGQVFRDLASDFSSCSEQSKNLAKSLFTNGRNVGLSQYCSPENAFELGKVNQEYNNVCQPQLEEEFLKSYSRGIRFYDLKSNNASLKKKIFGLQIQVKEGENIFLKEISKLEKSIKKNNHLIKKLNQF